MLQMKEEEETSKKAICLPENIIWPWLFISKDLYGKPKKLKV